MLIVGLIARLCREFPMIDLEALRRSAEPATGEDGDRVCVSRNVLKQCADEIAAGRAAAEMLAHDQRISLVCSNLITPGATVERRDQ